MCMVYILMWHFTSKAAYAAFAIFVTQLRTTHILTSQFIDSRKLTELIKCTFKDNMHS